MSQGIQSTITVVGTAAELIPDLVPFIKFLPLINEVGIIFDEIIKIVDAAEHNKRTCKILKKRVRVAKLAVQELKEEKEDKEECFNNKNYSSLQDLSNIIKQIKKFISEISQMKTLTKYFKAKSIEKTFTELCREFDSAVSLLSLSINVKIVGQLKSIDGKLTDELKELKADQDEFAKYLQDMLGSIKGIEGGVKDIGDDTKEMKTCLKDLNNQFSTTVVKVNAMSATMEKLMTGPQDQTKIDKIFQAKLLKLPDFEQDDNEKRKDGRVTKWYNVRNKCEEFAFKIISEEEKNDVQNQVTILKELQDWQNIIKFYGTVADGNKRYLVTEWAEYGNLREYYINNKDQFDLRLKLCMSLDIARGLSFLRTVEIVHRDIRAENILITLNGTAKLANFKLSRYVNAATLNQKQNLERVRYCAPELLIRTPDCKYDQRCEVYSFGILLWEIAEERIPYQDCGDIVEITEKVRNKMYREPFSIDSPMPKEFKQLEIEAVHQDPDFRPKITKMFEILRDCYSKRHLHPQHSSRSSISTLNRKPFTPPKRAFSIDQDAYALPINLPDFESFKYMTLADAAKQHKMFKNGKPSGDIGTAYKCFEAYANNQNATKRNRITAKYYKAVYISRGLAESPQNKDKIVAELFKEVADDEANEYPEAKVRYGDCLFNGKGVDKNESEALKYFEKAAEDGVVVAMYNVGNMYYNGVGCKKDTEKAKNYIELAVYSGYEPAIKFRNEYNF